VGLLRRPTPRKIVRFPKPARLRLCCQIASFGLFFFLLLRTEFRGSFSTSASDIRLPYPVNLFFRLDPLVALCNALSSRALYKGLLASLVILVPTLFLGRFFCGWICPLGSLNHFFGSLKSERKRGKLLLESNRYKRWQNAKYYLLIAVLIGALLGTGIVGWLDPFSLLVRSIGLSILPSTDYAVRAALQTLEHSRFAGVQIVGGVLHFVLGYLVLSFKQPYFRQGVWLGLIFIFILALNFRITRLWCRAVCPLGALLGIVSRWSVLGLVKHPEHCNDCNRCLLRCQGGDDPVGGVPWHQSECHLCLNCVDECPEKSLEFKLFPTQKPASTNLQRRKVLTGLASGVALVPILRSTPGFAAERNERLLRPPGAVDEEFFLSRCIRCGECMKVCPNNALQPALNEAGLEGLWTPILVPRAGYCETSCVLCSQVCPTGAIWEITAEEKGWSVGLASGRKPIRLGTAFYDRGRCLPWAMATDCIVCEEWCPTSPKAIYFRPAEVFDASGNAKQVKQPYVDPSHCVGCGACEHACPVQDRPAVYVTSVGESRSHSNQILLNRKKS
jgi:polyferredoxin